MTRLDHVSRATEFREINLAGRLLLPNAWDAASARVFEEAGFPAIATTSAGIAYARGLRDGQLIERNAMVREIASIVAACQRPVSADIEAGYGPASSDVAETVDAVLEVGAVGVNLEDNTGGVGQTPLFSVEDQASRIAAARSRAERRGVPLVINARTDTFLLGLGTDLEERVAMTIERGRAYLQAGADLVFVPLAIDPDIVRQLADAIGPISVMAVPGAPAADVLFTAGARRVSLGAAAMLATLGALREIAKEVHEAGTWTLIERSFYPFHEAQALFDRRT
ncbi:MAG: isocitrate lyase/phosphoenolpyruvate mutase family protein [Luteitalea sp.]|nr:isocitrate lyase/phosphoenolpyruvate mutase family protein [Luteitalea sp.]